MLEVAPIAVQAFEFQVRDISYLAAAVLFIFALKAMASPRTARAGNLLGAVGMLVAIIFTLVVLRGMDWTWIILGLVVGGAIGAVAATKVQMTAIPQMVALFNGFGGLASGLVVLAEFFKTGGRTDLEFLITVGVSTLIGWVTFAGSVVAFGKLQGILPSRPVVYPLQRTVNFLLLAAAISLIVAMALQGVAPWPVIVLAVTAAVIGVLFVMPIGGADMPVVISLLNSYSGLAAAATGFVLGNAGLIISGALVGASGIVLTRLMCVAMNRSLANVLFGAVGQLAAGPAGEQKRVTSYTPVDAAMVLENARKVIFVPGYGMAVAQAQHAVKELADLLESHGTQVQYAIHPVAGRMPGHMNVLLAEADVPYAQLCELDQINPEFEIADVAMVIGANDVINPAARYDEGGPIYGMPILNADKARTVMICKRSLSPGFAGIDNELFYAENTMMLFGDGKDTVTKVTAALKS